MTARQQLLTGLPLTERRLVLAGVPTAVLEGGDGVPLVLLHGGIECGGTYWAPVLSQLTGRYRVVVPDLPGLGESAPASRVELAFVDWFADLLSATCDEQPALVAHSLTGGLAASYALQLGGLRRLVLYGSPAIGRYRLPLGLMLTAIRLGLRPSRGTLERFERWAFVDPRRTKQHDPGWFQAFDEHCLALGSVSHVKQTMRRLVRTQTKQIPEEALRSIGVPTALLWGRNDRMVSLELADDVSSRLGWPLHVIDDAGHGPHLEQPDRFVRALSEALAA